MVTISIDFSWGDIGVVAVANINILEGDTKAMTTIGIDALWGHIGTLALVKASNYKS